MILVVILHENESGAAQTTSSETVTSIHLLALLFVFSSVTVTESLYTPSSSGTFQLILFSFISFHSPGIFQEYTTPFLFARANNSTFSPGVK